MRLDTVGVRYGRGPWVLRDVSLDLSPSRLVAVLGPNGSGKSTLLRVIAGVQRPSAGRVVDAAHPVAYVPERIEPPPLTVGQWCVGLAAVRGHDGSRTAAWLDALHVTAATTEALGTLSKGTWRKVLLADALASASRVLVLDEPWADLDAEAVGTLTAALVQVARGGALVVVSDHTGEAARVADTVVAPSGVRVEGDVDLRYRGPATGAGALDEAAGRLGFRRVGQ